MNEKPYSKVDKTYYPKPKNLLSSEDEVKGNRWRAWKEAGKVYFEYDAGHFATEMRTVDITDGDFRLLRAGKLTDKDLANKYG